MTNPDYDGIPEYDDQDSSDAGLEMFDEGMDRASRHSVLVTSAQDGEHPDPILPDEVRRRQLRGSQFTKLKNYAQAQAAQNTPGGRAILYDLGGATIVVDGRWFSDSQLEFDLTAPALMWLRRRKKEIMDLLPESLGESPAGRLVQRLFE